jgi:hypothetical protein
MNFVIDHYFLALATSRNSIVLKFVGLCFVAFQQSCFLQYQSAAKWILY